jgi:hypothetical protein
MSNKKKQSCPATRHGGAWRGKRCSSYSFLTSALEGGEWSASRPSRALPQPRFAPAALCPGERTPGTHCTGGWVGLRAGLDTEVKGKILCPGRGSNPERSIVQSVVRHYTDSATPAPHYEQYAHVIVERTLPCRMFFDRWIPLLPSRYINYKASRYKSEALRLWPQRCNTVKPTRRYDSFLQVESNSCKICCCGSGCSFYRTLSRYL